MTRSEILLGVLNFAVGALVTAFTVWLGAVALFLHFWGVADDPRSRAGVHILFSFAAPVAYVIVVGLLIVCSVFPKIFSKMLPPQLKPLQSYINFFIYLIVVVCLAYSETTRSLL